MQLYRIHPHREFFTNKADAYEFAGEHAKCWDPIDVHRVFIDSTPRRSMCLAGSGKEFVDRYETITTFGEMMIELEGGPAVSIQEVRGKWRLFVNGDELESYDDRTLGFARFTAITLALDNVGKDA